MSNNTARLAREWAESRNPNSLTGAAKAAREHILATTDPLTMADVEWDWEKHYLAGATNEIGDVECVMIAPMDGMIVNAELGDGRLVRTSTVALTPNGKKYELREVGAPEQPAHPATLETLEDYENAPVGTVVAEPGRPALTKTHGWEWHRYGGWFTSDEMADTERQVLRWGKDGETSEPTVSSNENVGADQQEHPETLVTEQDYANAPEGTVVAKPGCFVWQKRPYGEWRSVTDMWRSDREMTDAERRVLRRGWGK